MLQFRFTTQCSVLPPKSCDWVLDAGAVRGNPWKFGSLVFFKSTHLEVLDFQAMAYPIESSWEKKSPMMIKCYCNFILHGDSMISMNYIMISMISISIPNSTEFTRALEARPSFQTRCGDSTNLLSASWTLIPKMAGGFAHHNGHLHGHMGYAVYTLIGVVTSHLSWDLSICSRSGLFQVWVVVIWWDGYIFVYSQVRHFLDNLS